MDFGSGYGITANHFATDNNVVAAEASKEMLESAVKDNNYMQIQGGVEVLGQFEDESFDVVICHNVFEYVSDREKVLKEFNRVLKKDGIRTFWDLQQNQEIHKDKEWQEKMIDMEIKVSEIDEYRKIAFFHHLIMKKL